MKQSCSIISTKIQFYTIRSKTDYRLVKTRTLVASPSPQNIVTSPSIYPFQLFKLFIRIIWAGKSIPVMDQCFPTQIQHHINVRPNIQATSHQNGTVLMPIKAKPRKLRIKAKDLFYDYIFISGSYAQTAIDYISSGPAFKSLQLIYQTLKQKPISSMSNQQANNQPQPSTPNGQENPISSSPLIPQVQIAQTPISEQNVENFFHQVQSDGLSSDEDSMVSFQSTILDQHLRIARLQIQKMTNILIGTIKFDLLKDCREPELFAERPTFHEYLDWGFSLLKKDEVPFLKALLVFCKNSNKFLKEIFDASPQLLVHELVFITYQTMKSILPIHGIDDQINQFQELARHPLFIRMICDHPQLDLLSYSHVFSKQKGYHEEIRQKVSAFLEFYILTCLLVFENYFINPYYQKNTKTRKIEKQRKYRRKFIGKERKDYKNRKNEGKK